MTAELRVVEAETNPGPPGSADVEDAFYYYRSQIDSPSTEGVYRTDYTAGSPGAVHVYYVTHAAFTAWARYLGFEIQSQPKGQALLYSAIGSVPFRGRHYAVALHFTRFRDTGDLA